jgi:hypothetical protein
MTTISNKQYYVRYNIDGIQSVSSKRRGLGSVSTVQATALVTALIIALATARSFTRNSDLMLNGAAVSWRCKRQSVSALSSAEAEFIAASSMVQEVIFLRKFLDNLGFKQNTTPIFC